MDARTSEWQARLKEDPERAAGMRFDLRALVLAALGEAEEVRIQLEARREESRRWKLAQQGAAGGQDGGGEGGGGGEGKENAAAAAGPPGAGGRGA